MAKKVFYSLLISLILVHFSSLFADVFMYDSALYATISKSLDVTGNFSNIYVDGKDWLDKPHFPFWVCSIFIDIFGANAFGYKLPSFIFFNVALYYTYKLSTKIYTIQVAQIATLIVASALHIFISNTDVRAEAMLIGLIMGATYYTYLLKNKFNFKNVIFCSLFAAAAVMTKGIFILIIPYAALFFELLLKKQYQKLCHIKWLGLLLVTLLFITPEIIALYRQFNLQPEKLIFGKKNVSGIQFFFWDSQFGRFFNCGPIRGKGDKAFYLHTLLWSFAPWAIIGIAALFNFIKSVFKKEKPKDYFTFFGFSILFIVFSLSKFQLPHYLNILFPFLAILIANVFYKHKKWVNKTIKISVNLYSIVYILVILLLEYYFKTDALFIGVIIMVVLLFVILYFNKQKTNLRFIYLGCISSLLFFIYLNAAFYPKLLTYQSGKIVANYIDKNYPNKTIHISYIDWLLQYYSINSLHQIDNNYNFKTLKNNTIILADKQFITALNTNNINYKILKQFKDYRITKPTKTFLNSNTRTTVLDYRYLIRITNKIK